MYDNPSAGKFDRPPTAAERDKVTFEPPSRLWILPLALIPLGLAFMQFRQGAGGRGSQLGLPFLWFAFAVIRFALNRRTRKDREERSRTGITR